MFSPRRGFTLIELLVVMVILVIILLLSVPSFLSAQRKINLRNATDTVVQETLGAKNLAVTGFRHAEEVASDPEFVASLYVGLYFQTGSGELKLFTKTKQEIENFINTPGTELLPTNQKFEKTILLPASFKINKITRDDEPNSLNDLVILYSPLGEMLVKAGNTFDYPDDIKLVVGFEGQNTGVYSKKITVHRVTNLFTIDNDVS